MEAGCQLNIRYSLWASRHFAFIADIILQSNPAAPSKRRSETSQSSNAAVARADVLLRAATTPRPTVIHPGVEIDGRLSYGLGALVAASGIAQGAAPSLRVLRRSGVESRVRDIVGRSSWLLTS